MQKAVNIQVCIKKYEQMVLVIT